LYKLDQVMEGDIEELVSALLADHQTRLMAAQGT
jgi:peptide chain release factor 1